MKGQVRKEVSAEVPRLSGPRDTAQTQKDFTIFGKRVGPGLRHETGTDYNAE